MRLKGLKESSEKQRLKGLGLCEMKFVRGEMKEERRKTREERGIWE
jgi:hypothetical protein